MFFVNWNCMICWREPCLIFPMPTGTCTTCLLWLFFTRSMVIFVKESRQNCWFICIWLSNALWIVVGSLSWLDSHLKAGCACAGRPGRSTVRRTRPERPGSSRVIAMPAAACREPWSGPRRCTAIAARFLSLEASRIFRHQRCHQGTYAVHHWQCSWCREDDALRTYATTVTSLILITC